MYCEIITTIHVVNTPTVYSYNFFLAMGNFKAYSAAAFQYAMQCG